jgi:hypothetical protein
MSTKRNEHIITIKSNILILRPLRLKHCPNVRLIAVISKLLHEGISE